MKLSLYEALKDKKDLISFHMPAHNNSLPKELLEFDTTELPYSDDLLNSKGIIKDLENKIAAFYNMKAAFISTNGATSSIFSAVFACKNSGAFLIVGDCHKSIFNAVRLAKTKCYIADKLDEKSILPEDIGSIILTSPDYFGNIKNLAFYSKIAKKNNLILIIDASHGSHFQFSEQLPESATKYGDLVIHSFHKTLPVVTGGACLLCNKSEIIPYCNIWRKIFHSSSPSYIVMASIDRAFKIFIDNGEELYHKVFQAIKDFQKKDLGEFVVVKNDDFSRLVVESKFDGKNVFDKLIKKNMVPEMNFENKIVAITNPYNYIYLHKLGKVLKEISKLDSAIYKKEFIKKNKDAKITVYSYGGEFRLIKLDDAAGERAYSEIGLYPPGVPLIKAGDVFSKELIEFVKKNIDNCFGLENGMVLVI